MSTPDEKPTYGQLADENKALRCRLEARATAVQDVSDLLTISRQEAAAKAAQAEASFAQATQAGADLEHVLEAARKVAAERDLGKFRIANLVALQAEAEERQQLDAALIESLTADLAAAHARNVDLTDQLALMTDAYTGAMAKVDEVQARLTARIEYAAQLTRDLARSEADVENLRRGIAVEKGLHAQQLRDLKADIRASWWPRWFAS